MQRFFRFMIGGVLSVVISTGSWADFSKQEVQAQFASAYQSLGLGRYDEAIKALTVVYLNEPTQYFVNLKLGYAYYLNQQYANARHHYQVAHNQRPTAFSPFLGLMNIALAQQNYQTVEKYGFELLKYDLHNYYANLKLSYALIEQNKDTLAQSLVTKMLTYYPEDSDFLLQQAWLYRKAKNERAAKKIYELILTIDPNNVTANYFLTQG